MGLLRNAIFCHPRESGDPEPIDFITLIDSRSPLKDCGDKLHGNDIFIHFATVPRLKGFTLVEIMISVLILGVGLTLVANSYLVALRGVNITANNIGALNLAKEKLEALEVLSLKDGLPASTTRESLKTPAKNYDFTQEVVEITQPEVLAEQFVLACFRLDWQEQNTPKNVTLSTYLRKQKE